MPFSGIDLWHAVEFSRYGCALHRGISSTFQGRPPNLVHGYAHVKTAVMAFIWRKCCTAS